MALAKDETDLLPMSSLIRGKTALKLFSIFVVAFYHRLWYLTRRSVQQSENKITKNRRKVKRVARQNESAEERRGMMAEDAEDAKAEMQIEKRMREPLSKVLAYRTTESEAEDQGIRGGQWSLDARRDQERTALDGSDLTRKEKQ